eukprot:scaffold38330_cov31-Tisochrysis_lutea.AAC.3
MALGSTQGRRLRRYAPSPGLMDPLRECKYGHSLDDGSLCSGCYGSDPSLGATMRTYQVSFEAPSRAVVAANTL